MTSRRESIAFALILSALLGCLLRESLFAGKVLSSADVLFAEASFREVKGPNYQPLNRLQIDPVLQFQPWLAFNRQAIRAGRLPLWNDYAGCGTPHLANAQSAPFDPFHAIAYLGRLPDAYGWMAFARLWVGGFGMFQLAKAWNLRRWGRWFSGLAFPLSGFLIAWLSFPVTSVAIWLPWLMLATDQVIEMPGLQRTGRLALVVGFAVLAGHIQTTAHCFLATGLYGVWKLGTTPGLDRFASFKSSLLGLMLGLGIGAITIVPLWSYLGQSPVWESRRVEFHSPFRLDRPRLLDSLCTAFPYAYGSPRREHPNLAKALGVHNLNESAGGYAGLATLIWLAPLAWTARGSVPVVKFLMPLAGFGFLAAFGVTPFSNALRLVPILDVTDNRRLTLWVAFGLSMLGGIGLDHLDRRLPSRIVTGWLALLAVTSLTCFALAFAVSHSEQRLMSRSIEHYRKAFERADGASLADYEERASNQVRKTLSFVPNQLGIAGAELACLGLLGWSRWRGAIPGHSLQAALMAVTLLELSSFADGLNPAIDRADHLPITPLIRYLKTEVGDRGRILGIGEELIPNTLMRYGLADIRNYDSIELGRNLDAFPSLFEPEKRGTTSRCTIRWKNVIASLQALEDAGVMAVVASTPPPGEFQGRVDKVGSVWVARLDGKPWIEAASGRDVIQHDGSIDSKCFFVDSGETETVRIRTTFDRGFEVSIDGRASAPPKPWGRFIAVDVPAGKHEVALNYRPAAVGWALLISLASLTISLSCLTVRADFSANGLGRLGAFRVE